MEQTKAYVVFFRSFIDQKEHFYDVYTDEKIAKLVVSVCYENEHEGCWYMSEYRFDESAKKWIRAARFD